MRGHTAVVIMLAAAAWAMGQSTVATPPLVRELTVNLPPTGIGSTETFQITVANTASNIPNGTAASCGGTISLLNAAGGVIGSATPFTVGSGDMSSVKFSFSQAGGNGSRVEVRAVIGLSAPFGTPCSLAYSLETFDTSSGATHLFYTGNALGVALPVPVAVTR